MNLGQLEVLVAIVDTGSLTEAAETVGLTQSAVSHSLNRLETELGVTLLERGRQGVAVTRIGKEVVQHARSILNQVEIIRQKTARERGLSVGKLRFGCVPNVPARVLTGIIRDFQHKYPDIEIVLFEGNPQELIDWLAGGVIDIGTVVSPDDYDTTVPLARSEIKALVSVDHPLASQPSVPVQALMDQPLIGPKVEYGTFVQMAEMHNIPLPHLRYEVSALNTILAMVRENMGVSLMPEMLIDTRTDGIQTVSLDPNLFLQVYLSANVQSPATQTFLENAHRWAREHGFLPDKT